MSETEATIDPGSGLTEQERRTVALLASAWNQFTQLSGFSSDDAADFRKAIHDAERIIATRALARLYSDFWR